MSDLIAGSFKHALMITTFVFVMMLLVDYLNVVTSGKLKAVVRGNKLRQYTIASFLGATPGCLGSFFNVSFYIHGLLSFGAIAGAMVATSGDEAFVMLSLFPEKALLLFGILFVLGIFSAGITDFIADKFKFKACNECRMLQVHSHQEIDQSEQHTATVAGVSWKRALLLLGLVVALLGVFSGWFEPHDWGWKKITTLVLIGLTIIVSGSVRDHYLEEHIWNHLVKKHIWRVFLWTFSALLLIQFGLKYIDLNHLIGENLILVLLLSAVIGIIPESGPHMIFVILYSKGLIPFSVLLTSSIVQDGHGILPLLSYTLKDSLYIKIINMIIGLAVGFALMAFGV